jgi:hypothetical protein
VVAGAKVEEASEKLDSEFEFEFEDDFEDPTPNEQSLSETPQRRDSLLDRFEAEHQAIAAAHSATSASSALGEDESPRDGPVTADTGGSGGEAATLSARCHHERPVNSPENAEMAGKKPDRPTKSASEATLRKQGQDTPSKKHAPPAKCASESALREPKEGSKAKEGPKPKPAQAWIKPEASAPAPSRARKPPPPKKYDRLHGPYF